jgi:hypothetical protein
MSDKDSMPKACDGHSHLETSTGCPGCKAFSDQLEQLDEARGERGVAEDRANELAEILRKGLALIQPMTGTANSLDLDGWCDDAEAAIRGPLVPKRKSTFGVVEKSVPECAHENQHPRTVMECEECESLIVKRVVPLSE